MLIQDPELSIEMITETGDPEVRPGAGESPEPGVEPWIDPAGEVRGYFAQEGDDFCVRLYGVGRFAFSRHSGLVRAAREPEAASEVFEDVLHRQLLPFVLQRQSWEVLHASGLVVSGVPVALCGDREMGKSTLAHAWRCRGGTIYADDAVVFRVDGESVSLRRVPFKLRLRPATRERFGPAQEAGGLLPNAGSAGREKEGTLGAIYLLDRRREEAEGPVLLEPVAPEHALPALLRQAFCLTLQDRARNCRMIETYLAIMNRVPIFRLSYPTGLRHVDPTLDRLAAHVASLDAAVGQGSQG